MSDDNQAMNGALQFSLNDFPSGVMVTNPKREIIFVNDYFKQELKWNLGELIGKNTEILLTNASKIFYESYLLPLILHEMSCSEIQLAFIDGKGARVPILVNATLGPEGNIYWSVFSSSNRDKLYNELVEARAMLESRAEALRALSSTDELTGLMNRRELNRRAPHALQRAKRFQHMVSILMIDVDFFKKVNDTYGHLEGDRVLEELGKVLSCIGRETDLVSRFGGEEFLIVLPDTDIEGAQLLANKVHALVAAVLVADVPLTVSIGISIGDGNQAFEKLCDSADKALYQAKNAGRNTTSIYE